MTPHITRLLRECADLERRRKTARKGDKLRLYGLHVHKVCKALKAEIRAEQRRA